MNPDSKTYIRTFLILDWNKIVCKTSIFFRLGTFYFCIRNTFLWTKNRLNLRNSFDNLEASTWKEIFISSPFQIFILDSFIYIKAVPWAFSRTFTTNNLLFSPCKHNLPKKLQHLFKNQIHITRKHFTYYNNITTSL